MKQGQQSKFIKREDRWPNSKTKTEPTQQRESRRTSTKPAEGKVRDKQAKSWSISCSEADDMKTQFKYRKLREIDETRKFEAEESRIRAQLKKRSLKEREKLKTLSPGSPQGAKQQPQTDRASANEFLELSMHQPEVHSHPKQVANPNPIPPLLPKQSIPEEIIIADQKEDEPAAPPNALRPMLKKVFQAVRPKFEINTRNDSNEDSARQRMHRRESYYNRICKAQQNNDKPLEFHKLLEWKVKEDQRSHPAKYKRLAHINLSAKDICLAKNVEIQEKQALMQLGNEYMLQARKKAKSKAKTEESVQQPTFTHRYIDYMPQVRQPRIRKEWSPPREDREKVAKQLQLQALSRIEEYVDRRKQGLRYTQNGQYEREIDNKLITYVNAKVACLE